MVTIMKISLKDIKEKYPELQILNYREDTYFETFNHDSRVKIEKSLFIPIIGEKFDGHNFVESAFTNGSVVSLYRKDHLKEMGEFQKPLIVVEDIEEGLEKIVGMVREHITVPVIAITGSTGKTTTREMLSTILSLKGKVLNSDRNYNTLWGNAQLLSTFNGHDYVVLEFGMDRSGEIASQCRAINPDMGILLNVGSVHAEKLGSIENVYLAKRELADYLLKENKPLILNIDDERLSRISSEFKEELTTIGSSDSEYQISNVEVSESGTSFRINSKNLEEKINLPTLGKGYAYNAASAIAVAVKLGFTLEECRNQLNSYAGFEGRFQIKRINNHLTVVDDAYNANPTSMKMSLETFDSIWCSRNDTERILILGDMRELGEVASEEHERIGEQVKRMNIDKVYYIGDYFEDFGFGEKLEDSEEVLKVLQDINSSNINSVVLLKASHSFGLSELIEKI